MLISLGLKAVEEEFEKEVEQLVGRKGSRSPENRRWGRNPGSVYLGDQKVRVEVPRVRNAVVRQEVPLESCQAFRKTKVKGLRLINGSVVESLKEGLEETLTLRRLGLFEELGISFITINCIENVNLHLERLTQRVNYWKNSDQRQRWIPTFLLQIEPG